jgi:hypothetical protein
MADIIGAAGAPTTYDTQNHVFAQSLFIQLLGRFGATGDLNYWAGRVLSVGREVAAQELLATSEYRSLTIGRFYRNELHRAASPAEISLWGTQDVLAVLTAIAGSDEFYEANRIIT